MKPGAKSKNAKGCAAKVDGISSSIPSPAMFDNAGKQSLTPFLWLSGRFNGRGQAWKWVWQVGGLGVEALLEPCKARRDLDQNERQ